MNIVCDKTLLSAAIDGVSKAVPSRSAIPALEGILLKADGFSLCLTGYDMELSITTTIEANVRQAGELVLNAKLLGDIVRRMPCQEVTIATEQNGNTLITGGSVEYDMMSISAQDYPELPVPGAEKTLTIQAGALRDILDKTLFAASTDDKRPAHTGALFEIAPEGLTVVALDGFRLALVQRSILADKSIRIIIPAKTLTEVSKLGGEDEQNIFISANRRFVLFEAGDYTILSRLLEGEFLDYHRVLQGEAKTTAVVNTRDFMESIERASLVITERLKNPLRITFADRITVRCQTALGKVVDECDAAIQGDEVEIGFNNRYLLDALRNARREAVRIEMCGPLGAVKIFPDEGNDFTFLVLPVRFKNEV